MASNVFGGGGRVWLADTDFRVSPGTAKKDPASDPAIDAAICAGSTAMAG